MSVVNRRIRASGAKARAKGRSRRIGGRENIWEGVRNQVEDNQMEVVLQVGQEVLVWQFLEVVVR